METPIIPDKDKLSVIRETLRDTKAFYNKEKQEVLDRFSDNETNRRQRVIIEKAYAQTIAEVDDQIRYLSLLIIN